MLDQISNFALKMRKLSMDELNRLSVNDFKQVDKLPVIIVLDNIRSLHNIGSVFRTADAFRVEAIYLCGITAKPPHREIHKTALGATESVDWQYFESTVDAVEQLQSKQYKIFAIEQTDQSIHLQDFDFTAKSAFIFGNEVTGVDENLLPLCDASIEIPQAGTKHSLNISVCTGVVIWTIFSQWNKFVTK